VVDWAGSLLEGDGLNVLINNAGIAHWEGFDAITKDLMLDCLETNCIAPLMLTKVVYALCAVGLFLCFVIEPAMKTVVNFSSLCAVCSLHGGQSIICVY